MWTSHSLGLLDCDTVVRLDQGGHQDLASPSDPGGHRSRGAPSSFHDDMPYAGQTQAAHGAHLAPDLHLVNAWNILSQDTNQRQAAFPTQADQLRVALQASIPVWLVPSSQGTCSASVFPGVRTDPVPQNHAGELRPPTLTGWRQNPKHRLDCVWKQGLHRSST